MHKPLAISLALLLAAPACVDRPSTPTAVRPTPTPIDLTAASEDEWRRHLGEIVTVEGRFSLQGKIGPFIDVGGRPIYIKPKPALSWTDQFRKFEESNVRVTGVLQYWQSPAAPAGPLTEARIPDHFYFQEEAAKVELRN